jgi:hypothetical protein
VTSQPPHSIISGVAYTVSDVQGTSPAADADFAGERTLRLVYRPQGSAIDQEHLVRGVGLVSEAGIYFNEKDAASGKDVRRWRISRRDDGYVAQQGLF